MSNYRRARTPAGSYFFTVVTYRRRPLLVDLESRRVLREMIQQVRQDLPFCIEAWVLLPEHLHCIWTLPRGDADYSKRWGLIKAGFSKRMRDLFRNPEWINDSKAKHRESTIWQRRFWEHEIRDQEDFNRQVDYIHWNPVKHGQVSRVADWPYSTFHRYVRHGVYPLDWDGEKDVDPNQSNSNDFGEFV
jgi:putative transposase